MANNAAPESDQYSLYGDFIDWEDDEAGEIEINAEPARKYRHGCKYYPLRVGEVLNGRYRIVHKLGYGGFSTVWMAQDLRGGKAVALKILVSGKNGDMEFRAQKTVNKLKLSPDIVAYHETFQVEGDGGSSHHVLVMPLRGPNLDTSFRDMCMATRMSAARQLLISLKTLHEAGIVHRDLNQGAVMWELKYIDGYDIDTQYKHLGRPQKLELADDIWKAGDLVKPMTIPPEFIGDKVYLGDFSLATRARKIDRLLSFLKKTSKCYNVQTPAMYCAPERYHGVRPNFASDIWSFMCIFLTLYLGFEPFYGSGGHRITDLWVRTLGPLPISWKGRYYYSDNDKASDDAWYDQAREPHPEESLESKLERREPKPGDEEKRLLMDIVNRVFNYNPAKRPTAAELLEDSSFNTLMRILGCPESEDENKG